MATARPIMAKKGADDVIHYVLNPPKQNAAKLDHYAVHEKVWLHR